MKDRIFMITPLDSATYATPRRIFLLQNEDTFIKNFSRLCSDKTVAQTFTSTKEVLYT